MRIKHYLVPGVVSRNLIIHLERSSPHLAPSPRKRLLIALGNKKDTPAAACLAFVYDAHFADKVSSGNIMTAENIPGKAAHR